MNRLFLLFFVLGLSLQPLAVFAAEGKPMELLPMVADLSAYGGRKIGVYGTLSKVPHQHLVSEEGIKGRTIGYLKADDLYQIVAYFPKPFAGCEGDAALQVSGEVLAVRGGPKKAEPQKRDEDAAFTEYQLKVSSWECLVADTPPSWMRELGLAQVPLSRKQDILDKLSGLGEPAMPLLISHLQDERQYGTRQVVPASAMNAPVNAPAPKITTVKIPVSQVCQDLLYSMLSPEYISPYAGNFKPYSNSFFMIHDWPKWWLANQHKSLAQIRKELEPRVDDYWRSHGTSQILDADEKPHP